MLRAILTGPLWVAFGRLRSGLRALEESSRPARAAVHLGKGRRLRSATPAEFRQALADAECAPLAEVWERWRAGRYNGPVRGPTALGDAA
jgi:hypothetical protein